MVVHDMDTMEHEIRDLLNKLEAKDRVVKEHKDSMKTVESQLEIKTKAGNSQIKDHLRT